MTPSTGTLLIATPALVDPNFVRTVVLMVQHDEDGSVGVVLNRPTAEPVVEHLPGLDGWVVEPAVVFSGGPVEPAVAIGLERVEIPARPVDGVSGVGVLDLSEPFAAADCRVFSGYSGWGPGQLEAEIEEGSWILAAARPEDVFTAEPDGLWPEVLRRQGGRLALLASYPGDPTLN